MSAKRLKLEGFNGERRPRIGAPNFGSLGGASAFLLTGGAARHLPPSLTTAAVTQTDEPAVPVHLKWSPDDLFKIDAAIHMYLTRNHTTTLSLDDFYALQSKLTTTVTYRTSDSLDLSDPERFLYDFLCLTMPDYYVFEEEGSSNALKPLSVPLRATEFHRRADNLKVKVSVRTQILEAIRAHRETKLSSKTKAQQLLSTATIKTTLEKGATAPLIRPGMTLDERIKARALAKQTNQAAEKEQDATKKDNAWLIRLADILWAHCRSILDKQARFQSPKSKSTTTAVCSLTVKDAVLHLARTEAAFSRKQIHAAIGEMGKLVPDWIRLSDPEHMAKDSTVWIHVDKYDAARAKLAGKTPPKRGPLTTTDSSATKISPESDSTTVVETPRPNKKPRSESYEEDVEEDGEPTASKAKKQKTLRINPFLILSDADHDGGEIIVPSRFDSPRGLKSLFDQLKSGQRI